MSDPVPPKIVTVERRNVVHHGADRIEDLAALEVGVRQGDPFHEIPVRAYVSCGRPTLQIGEHIVGLAVRQVMIRVELENAEMPPSLVRRVSIQEGEYQTATQGKAVTRSARETKTNIGGELSGSASAAARDGTAKLTAGANRESRNGNEAQEETSTQIRPTILLIADAGRNTIAIGHAELGDPRQGGLLYSIYPQPGKEDDEEHALFALRPLDQTKPIRVTVTTAVPSGKLQLEQIEGPKRKIWSRKSKPDDDAAKSQLKKRGKAVVNQHIEELRVRMVGDELQRRIVRNQADALRLLGLNDGEFAVSIESFELWPQGFCAEGGDV